MLRHRFVRFLLVGGVNTLFGYSCFALFIFLGLHYAIALFFGTILGILFNFKTTGYFVFETGSNRRVLHFFAVYGIVFLCNLIFLKMFSLLGVSPYLSGAALVLPMAALSYLLNRKLVFEND